MPADHLTADQHTAQHTTLNATVRAVLAVLNGAPLDTTAADIGMESAELADAADLFQQAGRRALERHNGATGWWQIYVEFADWDSAEQTVTTHLAPQLNRAEASGAVNGWWFIRKRPCWRMRLGLSPDSAARADIGEVLDELVAAGQVRRWWTGIYEPEESAFGGPAGIAAAHALFHADSKAILGPHRDDRPLGRRELSVLLCTVLMRAARLEWYEQADVWHHVSAERPLPADFPPGRLDAMTESLRAIAVADTTPGGSLLGQGQPLAFAAPWADAFRDAGQTLYTAASEGRLNRGLRQVVSYHVIFHWNRLGFPARTQSALARSAHAAMMNFPARD